MRACCQLPCLQPAASGLCQDAGQCSSAAAWQAAPHSRTAPLRRPAVKQEAALKLTQTEVRYMRVHLDPALRTQASKHGKHSGAW